MSSRTTAAGRRLVKAAIPAGVKPLLVPGPNLRLGRLLIRPSVSVGGRSYFGKGLNRSLDMLAGRESS